MLATFVLEIPAVIFALINIEDSYVFDCIHRKGNVYYYYSGYVDW